MIWPCTVAGCHENVLILHGMKPSRTGPAGNAHRDTPFGSVNGSTGAKISVRLNTNSALGLKFRRGQPILVKSQRPVSEVFLDYSACTKRKTRRGA